MGIKYLRPDLVVRVVIKLIKKDFIISLKNRNQKHRDTAEEEERIDCNQWRKSLSKIYNTTLEITIKTFVVSLYFSSFDKNKNKHYN